MLNRQICIRCITEQFSKKFIGYSWNALHEIFWDRYKSVDCSFSGLVNVLEEPPEECPYALEHVVSAC